jgi:hypothetical protein
MAMFTDTMFSKVPSERGHNGQTMVCTTFRPSTDDKQIKDNMKQRRISFDSQIEQTLGTGFKPDDYTGDPDVETSLMPQYGNEQGDKPQILDADEFDVDAYDQYIGAKVNFPQGDSIWQMLELQAKNKNKMGH